MWLPVKLRNEELPRLEQIWNKPISKLATAKALLCSSTNLFGLFVDVVQQQMKPGVMMAKQRHKGSYIVLEVMEKCIR
jgi:hypothetical protein